jgi:phage shock protein C
MVRVMAGPMPSVVPRALRRSRKDSVIAGVCGGLGRYLGVDPVLLRVAFVILAIGGGAGFLIYAVAWVVIPKESPGEELGAAPRSSAAAGRVLVGTALIALGAVILIGRYVSWFGKVIGPVTLIGIGIAVLIWGTRR